MRDWLWRVIVALDTLVGAFFPHGHIGQTISSRAETARQDGHSWGCWLCRILDRLDPNHCAQAVISDRARAQVILDDLKGR